MAKTATANTKAVLAPDNSANKRLDFDNIDVKRMLAVAKKSGLLHTDELNKHLNIDGISAEEIEVVKKTTSNHRVALNNIVTSEQIIFFRKLIRKIPIADNVLEYAVSLATKTRPGTSRATENVNNYISWGAGPRASQYLVLGAKCHAAINGKYSPDIEDVKAIADYVLRHRIVRNYKAEAEGITESDIIANLL